VVGSTVGPSTAVPSGRHTGTDALPVIRPARRPPRGRPAALLAAFPVAARVSATNDPAADGWLGAAVLIGYGIVAGVVRMSILRRRDVA
jgi:hypothetical protein